MHLFLAAILIFVAFHSAMSQTKDAPPVQNNVERELRKLEDEWLNSYRTGDKAAFDRIVADDFTGTDESAKVRNKTQERELVQVQPSAAGVTLSNEEVQFRVYEDTAVATGRIVSKLQSGGESTINFQSRFTDTFLKRQGRWQVVARHYSRVPPERVAIKLDSKLFDNYAGQYELAPNVFFTVTKEGDSLIGQAAGQPKIELHAESEISFFLKEVPAQILFLRDEKGQVARLIFIQDGRIIPARKIK